MITGILPPTNRDIEVSGYSITKDHINAKKNIGFVPDSSNVFLRLKGREYLSLMTTLYDISVKEAEEKIKSLTQTFDLAKDLEDSIGNYSHGMRQKLLVVGVLLTNPKNWILDEPMTGLDPASSFSLKEMMRQHADNGNTVLFSTHVLEVAQRICDRVGIIHKGLVLLPLYQIYKSL